MLDGVQALGVQVTGDLKIQSFPALVPLVLGKVGVLVVGVSRHGEDYLPRV
jgi:hypothetical protein